MVDFFEEKNSYFRFCLQFFCLQFPHLLQNHLESTVSGGG